jgi:hypothetical protein
MNFVFNLSKMVILSSILSLPAVKQTKFIFFDRWLAGCLGTVILQLTSAKAELGKS